MGYAKVEIFNRVTISGRDFAGSELLEYYLMRLDIIVSLKVLPFFTVDFGLLARYHFLRGRSSEYYC